MRAMPTQNALSSPLPLELTPSCQRFVSNAPTDAFIAQLIHSFFSHAVSEG